MSLRSLILVGLFVLASTSSGCAGSRHLEARGQKHAEQAQLCEEQAVKRRALGIPSVVKWDNEFTCRATGGMVETGKL